LVRAHEHKPPHGGTLVVFGEEFAHLELVLDAKLGKLTAYVLDGEAEKFVRLPQKQIELRLRFPEKYGAVLDLALKAAANPLTGEKEGDTAQFDGESEALKGAAHFSGAVVALAIRGAEFKDVQFRFPEGNEEKK
jgi:hypothetical protein